MLDVYAGSIIVVKFNGAISACRYTQARFTIWTQAAALSCVEGVSYDYHTTYFRNKLVAGAI